MEDHKLVHTFCRKERLTLFNFLKMHESNQHRTGMSQYEYSADADVDESLTLNEERIKELIRFKGYKRCL